MSLMRLFVVALLLCPIAAFGQSFEEIARQYPTALRTHVTGAHAYIYQAPSLDSEVVGRLGQGREVLAYRKLGDFYAVALPQEGHAGYVLLTRLDVPQDPGALTAPERPRDYKDPAAARRMSFVLPGGGHLYADERRKGMALLAVSVAGFVGGYALSAQTTEFQCDDHVLQCQEETDYTMLLYGSAVGLASWIYGILDAPQAARRTNREQGIELQAALLPAAPGGALRPALGMRLRW